MSLFGKRDQAPESSPVGRDATDRVVSFRKAASVSLKKHGLEVDGTGGVAVYLVLDHSWSMQDQGFYARGDVQRITEQAFALAREIDSDGEVPVFYFSSFVSEPVIATSANISGFVDRTHTAAGWGGTNYVTAIQAVSAYHAAHGGGQPGLVIFQTDGSPDSRPAARSALKAVSGDSLFFAFVGFGPKRNVEFLFELDEIEGRVRDNASAFHAVHPQATADSDLYDGLLKEFTGQWLPQVL